jgi:MoxR-like ATPase
MQTLPVRIKENIAKVVVGKEDAVEMILIALLCGGHILIEDLPGLGKTTLVTALARSLDCSFKRIQFTPDLLPGDVTGYSMYNMQTGKREVVHGSIMAQVVLADELNRTSPKTQSALLEVMQEGMVTIDGERYPVPQPFIVLATENPVEQTGTFPLPEAQLDRFLMRIRLGYPNAEEERAILSRFKGNAPEIEPVATAEEILSMREQLNDIICAEPVMDYIVQIAAATRKSPMIDLGVSPRGSLALMKASMARAMLHDRSYTLPDDVQALARKVLCHRMLLSRQAILGRMTAEEVLADLMRQIRVPAVR